MGGRRRPSATCTAELLKCPVSSLTEHSRHKPLPPSKAPWAGQGSLSPSCPPGESEGRTEGKGLYLLARGRRAAEAGVTAVRAVRHGCALPACPTRPQKPLSNLGTSWPPLLTALGLPALHPPQVPSLPTLQPPLTPASSSLWGAEGLLPKGTSRSLWGLRALSCGFW